MGFMNQWTRLWWDRVLADSDLNGYTGSDMSGFGEIKGYFGIRQINYAGIRLLD